MIRVCNSRTLPMLLAFSVLVLTVLGGSKSCFAFVIPSGSRVANRWCSTAETNPSPAVATQLFSMNPDEDGADAEGADLAAQFFQMAQAKGVSIDESDLMEDDEDEDDYESEYDGSQYGYEAGDGGGDDEDDDVEPNIPQGAIDAFVGYDTSDVDANPTVDISNDQLYSEVKERVLDTAGGFVEMTRGAIDDDDAEYGYGDGSGDDVQEYIPPTTVPDGELTAGEVVLLVLTALNNNDNPYINRGVEILFGYSSPGSQIKNEEGLTPAEYGQFLKETEYKALFEHLDVTIEKGEYSFDGKKGFFTARLQTGIAAGDSISVNFILSAVGDGDDSAWLIDSILIRPQSMRRRRRK
eukprot:CAMPEP_0197187946 /NCGR_PEP_ID=MMETSP1423-20130617/16909_1 /TAXON_ID=476441 /ORGANISM="Pseudo-nitzschia heimii, Strain UNC1101" /LENGTH=352 /DNA_ID=CAMNT_0042639663 /DNA_START=52 /DNA_END=1110 /DNA_ORIENTATION=-